MYEQVLTDCRRVFGDDHPDTLISRSNLTGAYESAGRVGEAITLYEQVLTDYRRVLGDDQGRPGPVHVAAVPDRVPLHLREDVDPQQVQLEPEAAVVGEVGVADHAQHLYVMTSPNVGQSDHDGRPAPS